MQIHRNKYRLRRSNNNVIATQTNRQTSKQTNKQTTETDYATSQHEYI